MRERRLTELVLAVAAFVVHLPQWSGGRPFHRDAHHLYVPAKMFLADHLARGEWPLWWPYDGAGAPFLAQPLFSVLHPTSLAYALLPFWQAFAFQDTAATWLGMASMAVLARTLGRSEAASMYAGLSYGAGGWMLSLVEFPYMALSAGAAPAYLAALLRASQGGASWWPVPGLALGLVLLGGDPQATLIVSFVGAAVLVAARGWSRRTVLLASLSPVLGGAVAAMQAIPTALMVGATDRAGDTVEAADALALEPLQLLSWVVPRDLGTETLVRTLFFGTATLALAFATVPMLRPAALRRRPFVATAWGLVILSVLLALGPLTPLNDLARLVVPMWSKFRYPVKALLAAALMLPVLAATGFDRLARRRDGREARRAATVGGGALFAVSLLPAALPWGATLGALAGAVAVVGWGGADRPRRRLAALLAGVTLVSNGVAQGWVMDDAYWKPSAFVDAMKARGVGLAGPSVAQVELLPARDVRAYAALSASGGAMSLYAGAVGIPTLNRYSPGGSPTVGRLISERRDDGKVLRLLGTLSVGYVTAGASSPWVRRLPPGRVVAVDPDFDVALVAVVPHLPRAYAVHRALPASSMDEVVALLRGPSFKPGREFVLEATSRFDPAWSARPDRASVPWTVVARTNSTVTLSGEAPWPGFVVLAEAHFPGWRVTVDGTERELLRANGGFRAVEVGPGRHEVVFMYDAPGLRAGLWTSGASALLSGLFSLVMAIRRRRDRVARR